TFFQLIECDDEIIASSVHLCARQLRRFGVLRALKANYIFCTVTWLIWWAILATATGTARPAIAASAPASKPSAPAAKPAEPPAPIKDPFGRDTPYGTVIGFLRAVDKDDYTLAANFLEGKLSSKEKEDYARNLKVVLNRGVRIGLGDLSKVPE